jgi:hypothetical protein
MRAFEEHPKHSKAPDMMKQIMSNQLSCMTSKCHDTVHDVGTLKDATGRAAASARKGCAERADDDGMIFLADTIRIKKIRDEEAYEGIRVLLEARLAGARIPLQIEVGFGDVITPAPVNVEYPTLLRFPAPKMRAYPKENVVAEKLEALVKLGMANSRMKDFYDLWMIAERFEFHGPVLAEAVAATFADERRLCRRRAPWPSHQNSRPVPQIKHNGGRFC